MGTGRRRAGGATTLPIGRVVLAVVVILVLVIGGWLWVLSSGTPVPMDPPRPSGTPQVPSGSSDAPSAPPSIEEQYAALGANLTGEATGCTEDDDLTDDGDELVRARVQCAVPDGTMILTTYRSGDDFETRRKEVLSADVGTIMSTRDAGGYRSYDPRTSNNTTDPAAIYWDNRAALQSAELIAAEGNPVDTMARIFAATEPSVVVPEKPTDRLLQEMVSVFQFRNCKRVPIRFQGQSEENKCVYAGFEARAGRFLDKAHFDSFRARHAKGVRSDEDGFEDFWYHDTNRNGRWDKKEPRPGSVFGFVDRTAQPARAVLYIDDVKCGCYLQLIGGPRIDPTDMYAKVF